MQQAMFDAGDLPVGAPNRKGGGNPVLALYGAGPEGRICRDCTHLMVRQRAGRWYKCGLRGDTRGPATDHRVRWPACGRFVERPGGFGAIRVVE